MQYRTQCKYSAAHSNSTHNSTQFNAVHQHSALQSRMAPIYHHVAQYTNTVLQSRMAPIYCSCRTVCSAPQAGRWQSCVATLVRLQRTTNGRMVGRRGLDCARVVAAEGVQGCDYTANEWAASKATSGSMTASVSASASASGHQCTSQTASASVSASACASAGTNAQAFPECVAQDRMCSS